MENNIVNVERIMEEIRSEIRERSFDEIEDFEDEMFFGIGGVEYCEPFEKNEFMLELSAASQKYILPTAFPLEGKFKLIKKVIRKFSFFITRQLAEYITEYNSHIIRAFNQVRNYISESVKIDAEKKKYNSEVEDLALNVHSYSGKIRRLSEENRVLTQKIKQMEAAAEEYKQKSENFESRIEILQDKLDITMQQYRILAEKISHTEDI